MTDKTKQIFINMLHKTGLQANMTGYTAGFNAGLSAMGTINDIDNTVKKEYNVIDNENDIQNQDVRIVKSDAKE